MKTTLCLLALLFTGCASISDYNRGCRDGIKELPIDSSSEFREKYCNALDQKYRIKKIQDREDNSI